MLHRVKRCKNIPFVAAFGVCLLVAPTRSCDHERDCAKRIHKAEERLRKEIDRHGERSRQAEEKRHELEEARRGCGEEHHVH